MSGQTVSIKKALPFVIIWIVSLMTSLALVYVAPNIFPPLETAHIQEDAIVTEKLADEAIITVKLADGSVTSLKILDGSILAQDLSNGVITNIKIADQAITTEKILDGAITDSKLAPSAIPYNSTYSTTSESITSDSFVDLSEMAVNLTLNRTSHIIIMFSGEAWVDGTSDSLLVRAIVDSTPAYPDSGALIVFTHASTGQHGSNSFIFYLPEVDAGAHTIKIQFAMLSGTGHIGDRTLNVFALPA